MALFTYCIHASVRDIGKFQGKEKPYQNMPEGGDFAT